MTHLDPRMKKPPVLGDPATRHFLSADDIALLEGADRFSLLRRTDDAANKTHHFRDGEETLLRKSLADFEINLFFESEELACARSLDDVRALIPQVPGVTHVLAGDWLVLAVALCPDPARPGGMPDRKRNLRLEARFAAQPHAPLQEFATLLSAPEADPTLAHQRTQHPGCDQSARRNALGVLEAFAANPMCPARQVARDMLRYYETRRSPVASRLLRVTKFLAYRAKYPAILMGGLALFFFFALSADIADSVGSGLTVILLAGCVTLTALHWIAERITRLLRRLDGPPHQLLSG